MKLSRGALEDMMLNPRTIKILFFKYFQLGQSTLALNASGFFGHNARVIGSLSYKLILTV